MTLSDMFGRSLSREEKKERETEMVAKAERLLIELADAKREIGNLRQALGSNHRLTIPAAPNWF